jgi:hypothetical protein
LVAGDRDGGGRSENARQRRLRNRADLLRLDEPYLRGSALGGGARQISARAQLVIHEDLHGLHEHLTTIEIGFGGDHRALGGGHIEECGADSVLNVEPCQRFPGARLAERSFRADHRRVPHTKVEWFPGEQRAGRAAPYAWRGRIRQDRPGNGGQHALRQELPEDVVRSGAIRLPQ